jgi:TolB-like protein
VKGKVELDFEDIGEQNLKNVAEPVRVYRIAGDGSGTAAASPTKAPLPLPDKPSIAVLPFTNISGDPEQEYFADGITEDIITELSRFSSLFVIARNSSFTYKGQPVDIKKIARELGARYMLEGSIRRSETRVRITAQLLDSDGGGHVWAEKYDRDLIDVFELQDEITRSVVSNITPKIELAELERSRKLSDNGLTAYEQALKAQAYCYDALYLADPDLLNRAETAVNTALALDPRSIHALSTGSLIHMYRHMYGWGEDPKASLASSYKMAENLIRIDSSNAKAYMIRAWVYVYQRKFDAAIAEHRRALSLNPNLAMNLFAMSWSEAVAGHTDQAREHAQLALQLSPQESDIWTGEGYAAIALANFFDGDYAGAVKFGHLAYQRQPVLQALMAAANGYLEDSRSAKFHIEELKDFAPRFLSTVLSGETKVFKHPEHNELLLKGLRRACRLETQPGGK